MTKMNNPEKRRIKRPLTVSAVTLLGASLTIMISGSYGIVFLAVLIFSVLCVILAAKRRFEAKIMLLICIFLVTSCISFCYAQGKAVPTLGISGYNMDVTGEVCTLETKNANGQVFFQVKDISVSGKEVTGKMYVYKSNIQNLSFGDKISFTADSIRPSFSDGLYRYHSISDGTYLIATAYDGITVTEKAEKQSLYARILSLRKQITEKYSANLPEENAAVTTALITGDKNLLSDESLQNFRLSGVSHIFAVSGMHLSLWTGIFFLIFKSRSRISVISNLSALFFVIFYCIFTGFSPSVLRSGIMLGTVFIAKIIKRQSDTLNTWGLAGTALLTLNPHLAGNVSFLLSYAATFALIFFSQFILPEKENKQKPVFLKRKLISVYNSLVISICVILTTLPIVSVFFGYISLLSPLTSLIVTPLAEAVMILSGISVLLPAGNIISAALFNANEFFSEAILKTTAFTADIDLAITDVEPKIIIPCIITTSAVLVFMINRKMSKSALTGCVLIGAAVTISLSGFYNLYHSNETSVYIPSCGNATIISVIAPGNKTLIYGTGGEYSAQRQTAEYFNRKGEFSADYLFIPRSKASENKNTDSLISSLPPEKIYNLYSEGNTKIFSAPLWNNADIYSEISDDFAASVLNIENKKIVICTLPTSDFSVASEVFLDGDILICRNKIPVTLNPDNFTDTVIMTDLSDNLSGHILTTKNKNIEIILKEDSYAIN